uniref:Uncharacterized protein n=1 Tax=Anguilla anguilla TaxID=7936 RepID=A0A0E9WYH7_ANGAN
MNFKICNFTHFFLPIVYRFCFCSLLFLSCIIIYVSNNSSTEYKKTRCIINTLKALMLSGKVESKHLLEK